MSDSEEENYGRRESHSRSKMDRGSPTRDKSESRSGSLRPSRTSKRSDSRSYSRSKSRSSSRWHSSRHYSRSRSRSYSRRRKSRSRSYSPEYQRRRSQSASPISNRHTSSRNQDFTKEACSHGGDSDVRVNPDPSTCLGVFGLSLHTTERDLRDVFSRYGSLAAVNLVYDQRTGRSRGFAFVYFERLEDSREAMERANGMELEGRRIRVDYSITNRPHAPTPGIYMGRPTHNDGGGWGGSWRGRDRDSNYDRYARYEEYDSRYSRRRSPSPYYSRCGSRSRSHSYSPRRY